MDYLKALKTEFCRYYKLTPEYIEKVYQEAKGQEQDDLNTYRRAYEQLKAETRNK